MALTLDILVAGLLTVSILTFLWKDNKVFRIVEHLFVGVTAAQALVIGVDNVNRLAVGAVFRGNMVYVIPLILGLMMYFYFSKKYFYLTRYPLALLVGVMAGLTIRGQAAGIIYAQTLVTAKTPLIAKDALTSLNNIIIVTGMIAVMSFFIFTRKQTGILRYTSTYGRYIIMSAVGASYGGAVLIRNALLGGRMQALLLNDFIYVIPILLVLFSAWVLYDKKQSQRK